nr:YabP/YqfC family sporulation protein [uncultured Blautia sp.]
MKKREKWKDHLVSALELPDDLAYKEPIVTLTGQKQTSVENYKGLLFCTEEEITILTARGKLFIRGTGLEICSYTEHEMCIRGKITQITIMG